jgi:hypothetical protein
MPERGDCTVRASIPRRLSLASTEAKLYAWGELRCARAGRVAIEICAVRTLLRTCTPGKAYRSSIAVVGRPNDTGPYKVCRSL